MLDLIQADDADRLAYDNADPDFFLRAAGEEVRRYCGWHVSPNVVVTRTVTIGSRGIIMLPSLLVTGVLHVEVSRNGCDSYVLEPGKDYTAYRFGWLELHDHWARREGDQATVTFSSGYDQAPMDLKTIVLELASNATEMPNGVASDITSPGYRVVFRKEGLGLALTQAQKNRLSRYRITGTA